LYWKNKEEETCGLQRQADRQMGMLHFSDEFAVILPLLVFLLLCNLLLNAFQSGIFVDVQHSFRRGKLASLLRLAHCQKWQSIGKCEWGLGRGRGREREVFVQLWRWAVDGGSM